MLTIYPQKSFFTPEDPVQLVMENKGSSTSEILKIHHLTTTVQEKEILLPEGTSVHNIGTFPLGGYRVSLQQATTAFDVQEPHHQPLRYGYLSRFGQDAPSSKAAARSMLRLHVSAVMFYDWMYRHHDPVGGGEEYTDALGAPASLKVVRDRIQACHQSGMAAMAYGAFYACCHEYYEQHPEQALYAAPEEPEELINEFFIMDISQPSLWRKHITQKYAEGLEVTGFDGYHLDQYGYPKEALTADGRRVFLDQDFPDFIDEMAQAVRQVHPQKFNTFNNVNNWPTDTTANSDVVGTYIEVWKPYVTYRHLKKLIDDARTLAPRKPVVLSAYMVPWKEAGESVEQAQKALDATLLANAVILASGGWQLIYGEHQHILHDPYYLNDFTLSNDAYEQLRLQADFSVMHRELLSHPSLRDRTEANLSFPEYGESFADASGGQVAVRGVEISHELDGGRFGFIYKERPGWKVAHLINLLGNDSLWNTPKNRPVQAPSVQLEIATTAKVNGVYYAQPGIQGGMLQPLDWNMDHSGKGMSVHVEIPAPLYWGMVVIEEDPSELHC
ncbi:MAG: glycoside hydrolase family 66 protein [Spirochaetales bacterium]|nr:glycoside hydrolase family 66 protein [Spirochaetales bacterium]